MSSKEIKIWLTIITTLAPIVWFWLVFWLGHRLGLGKPGIEWWHIPYFITATAALFTLMFLACAVWCLWDDRPY